MRRLLPLALEVHRGALMSPLEGPPGIPSVAKLYAPTSSRAAGRGARRANCTHQATGRLRYVLASGCPLILANFAATAIV